MSIEQPKRELAEDDPLAEGTPDEPEAPESEREAEEEVVEEEVVEEEDGGRAA
jgi:hypothetical protein